METVRLLNSQSLHLFGDYVDEVSKGLNFSNNVFYSTRTLPFSRNCQISSASLQFVGNPSRKYMNKDDLWSSQSANDIYSVSKMIEEFTDSGLFEDAVRLYINALGYGFPVQKFRFFPCLIKAFGGLCDTKKSRQIHGHVLKSGFLDDIYVVNALLATYWKCGATVDAIEMFEKTDERDLVSWNTMISGFCQLEDHIASLTIFKRMIKEYGAYPNRVGCLLALSSCASLESLIHGREIHGFLLKSGLHIDEFLVSGLIDMYMKCADIGTAEYIFKSILDKESFRENIVIWNVMIGGYVCNGCLRLAFKLFIKMLELGRNPDSSTMVASLVLCSKMADLKFGKQIHKFVFTLGLVNDVRVETALMEMYFKCSDPETGLKVFSSINNNLVAWGGVISNCSHNGYPAEALKLFHGFMLENGSPDSVILLAVLRACSFLKLKHKSMEIHGLTVKMGFDTDTFIGGALVDAYGKCGDMESAQKAFFGLPSRDLISWNALISGYSQNGLVEEALEALHDMQSEQIRPNAVTVACVLSVCAQLSAMILCKELHGHLLRQAFETNVLVSNSLIATYAKCGDIKSSWTIFQRMLEKNEISWNSIILGFGMHGHTDEVFVLFEKMKEAGMEPDHVTLTALLSACSHGGKVDMGLKYFKDVVEQYKLEPQLEHYTCMVDLLGRAGHLKQAYDLIRTMPFIPDDRIWGSLLGSCRSHGNQNLAELAANHVFQLDPTTIGYRVLLANLYEDFGKREEGCRIRSEIKGMGLKKPPGCSWVEVNNNLHLFVAGDHSHPQSEEIYAAIESLALEVRKEGYVPHVL